MTPVQKRLREYQDIKREITQLRDKLGEIEAVLMHPRIQRINDMPSAPVRGYAQEDMIARHILLQELYSDKLQQLTAKQMETEQLIDGLQPRHRTLLRYRYVDGLKWEEICVKMGYCWRQVHRIHREALTELEEINKNAEL